MQITKEMIEKILEVYKTGQYGNNETGIQWKEIIATLGGEYKDIKIETLRKNSDMRLAIGGIPISTMSNNPIKEREPSDYATAYKTIDSQAKKIEQLKANQDNIIRAIGMYIDKMRPDSWKIQVPKPEKVKHDSQAHNYISDVHDGVKIKFRDTMGLSEYNPEMAELYFDTLTDKIASYREDDKNVHGLNKLVCTALGDTMEGTNVYKGQAFSVVLNELEQWIHSVKMWSKNILKLCSVFPEVELFCVGGNHGFGNVKTGNSPQFRADDFLYYTLKMLLKDVSNLTIYISDCSRMLVQHGHELFAYSHGNESTSWMGTPFYGINRTVSKLPKLTGWVIDHYVCAHFHTASNIDDGYTIINGCFPGGNNLSVDKMTITSRPSQKLLYFSKENGIFHENNIYLAPKPKLQQDSNGIYTPYNSLAL